MRAATFAFLFAISLQAWTRSAEVGEESRRLEERIARWISDWDDASFATRNTASRQLRDAGPQAFPALVEAAGRGSLEVLSRALALLKSGLYSDDSALKEAARRSLHQIAESPRTSAARSARQILQDFERPPRQLAAAQAFGPPPGVAQRINTWTFNGTTTVEAFEAGSTIKIQRNATGRIKVEITQKNQGVDVKRQFEAANAAELRARHPEAFQAFQKYEPAMQQAGAIAQRRLAPPALPQARPQRLPPLGMPGQPLDPREVLLRTQERQIELLQKIAAQAPTRESADTINRALQQVIESRDRLQREMGRTP